MRPGQNKRMRGRNNNNNSSNGGSRKGPNPLTRSYESNGPDVKIRGTAQHIGEKYLQLARDAQTSGDPVAAESYLQHAEHYFRIIAAAHQAQQQMQAGFVRQPGDVEPDDGDDDEELSMPDRFASPPERPVPQASTPQPYPERQPASGERQVSPERFDRQPERSEGQDRGYRQERYDRDARPDRQGQDRPANSDRQAQPDRSVERDRPQQQRFDRNDRNNRPGRFQRDGSDPRDGREARDPQYREQPRIQAGPREPDLRQQPSMPAEAEPDLPAFITAPVRIAPQPDITDSQPIEAAEGRPSPEDDGGRTESGAEAYAVRPRRRRRPRIATSGDSDGVSDDGSAEGES